MKASKSPRFEDLTEATGIPISKEGASMMYTRYRVASRLAAGQRVLEVGCGAGQGLGMVGAAAHRVVGGDYSMTLLRMGRAHYADRFPLVRLSAEHLPFADATFGAVLCFEVSYYVHDMNRAFTEIARVLRVGGVALFVNANPERPDFIKSPHSTHYHKAEEFREALEALGLDVRVEGAFAIEAASGRSRARVAARLARQVLEAMHLVPRTLRGRARLKRLVYGKPKAVPPEIKDGFGEESARQPVASGRVTGVKVLYVTARKPGPAEGRRPGFLRLSSTDA